MEKIRIAYIIDQLDIGGTERQLQLLINGLDRSRFDLFLFLLRRDGLAVFEPTDIDIQVLNIYSLASLNGLTKIFQLSRTLRKLRCQIVQTFFWDATIVGVLAGRLAGTRKIIVSVRDMLFWTTPLKHRIYRALIYLADGMIVNSFAVRDHIRPFLRGKRIDVIHNGIPAGLQFESREDAKKKISRGFDLNGDMSIVVLVSNCNRAVKRIELLVESIPQIIKKFPAVFLIVGDGHLRPELEQMVKDLNIEPFVRFTGQRNDVDNILTASDIAVNTSDSEGFSNSIMEAMRAGLPVVASDVAGNRELIKDGIAGLLFSPGNLESLAANLLKLLQDKELAKRMGEVGRELVESQYSVEAMVSKHTAYYESMLDK
jgi:glycosyltransferase involved in cell wall biosynthesis